MRISVACVTNRWQMLALLHRIHQTVRLHIPKVVSNKTMIN